MDFADALAEFTVHLPAWCGPDGLPRSWWHYVVGLRHIRRIRPRNRLDMAQATGAANATEKAHAEWEAATLTEAGW